MVLSVRSSNKGLWNRQSGICQDFTHYRLTPGHTASQFRSNGWPNGNSLPTVAKPSGSHFHLSAPLLLIKCDLTNSLARIRASFLSCLRVWEPTSCRKLPYGPGPDKPVTTTKVYIRSFRHLPLTNEERSQSGSLIIWPPTLPLCHAPG